MENIKLESSRNDPMFSRFLMLKVEKNQDADAEGFGEGLGEGLGGRINGGRNRSG